MMRPLVLALALALGVFPAAHVAGQPATQIVTDGYLIEGTVDGFRAFLTATDPTGTRTYTFPDGDVTITAGTMVVGSGTPVDNQVGVWTAADTMEGDAGLTFDGTTFQVSGGIAISNETEGDTARFTRLTSRDAVTLSGATTDSTTISVPSGAKVHGCSFNVNTAVVDDGGDDTWSAAFITGSTTTLATNAAAAQDTKVDTMIVDEITSDVAQVQFTPNAGNFTAGVIEVVCYYETLTSLAGV
jgi:hypothetical protein